MVDDGCKPIFFFFSGVVGDPPEVCMFFLFLGKVCKLCWGELFINEVHLEEL